MTSDTLKIGLANETLQKEYPQYGRNDNFLNLKVLEKGKVVVVVGPQLGEAPLFRADGIAINPKISKTDMKTLGPKRTELIQQKDEEIEELDRNIQEDQRVANDENEESAVRGRAREKVQENTVKKNELVKERARLKKGLSRREQVKEIFKNHGFTVTAVSLAAGKTIAGVFGALANKIKSVSKGVGNGFQELGKKIGSILPGLLGAIVSFVFRVAGQVISFLSKNAWLLILAIAAFLIEKTIKRNH